MLNPVPAISIPGLNGQNKICPVCNGIVTVEKTPIFVTEVCENCYQHCDIIDIDQCCPDPNLVSKKYIISNGTTVVRKQCESCGWVSKNSIGGFSPEQRAAIPLVNKERKETQEQSRLDSRCSFFKSVRDKLAEKREAERDEFKDEWFRQYNTYLSSPIWLHKRLAVLKRDEYICQSCLDPKITATEVHHLSYEFVDFNGSEPAYQLVSVCHACHTNIEKMKKLNREVKSNN